MQRNSSEYSGESLTFAGQKVIAEGETKKASQGMIYRALWNDYLTKIAIIPSMVAGMGPIFTFLVFSDILTSLTELSMGLRTADSTMRVVERQVIYMGLVSIGLSIAKWLQSFLWVRIGNRITTGFRLQLFKRFMLNDVTFFDTHSIGALLTILCEDTAIVQETFGTQKGIQLSNLGQWLAGIILTYIYSWKIGLVATASAPLVMGFMHTMHPFIMRHGSRRFVHTAESMTIAEETIAAVRTVRGFNNEGYDSGRYIKSQSKASHEEMMLSRLITIMFGTVMLVINAMGLACFYWGETMGLETGDLFAVFGFLMVGSMGMIFFQNSQDAESRAINAGGRIYAMLNYTPDIPHEGGEKPELHGKIEFRNVSFQYPTHQKYVLRNVSFTIDVNQTGALVGHSGSGKSTCVQLIERYYDVTEGLILIDGHDIRTIDPRYLHTKISLVSQEPTLFQGSIRDNVLYGLTKTDDEIMHALEQAHAKKFVEKLEFGLGQLVGDRGSVVSGGQRQRIAIARAMIRDPIIMITDEATSALDAKSEKKVQAALDKALMNRTGVIVAHRLSTIRNANVIYVFDTGEIVEVGTHDSLLEAKGAYYALVKKQLQKEDIETGDQQ